MMEKIKLLIKFHKKQFPLSKLFLKRKIMQILKFSLPIPIKLTFLRFLNFVYLYDEVDIEIEEYEIEELIRISVVNIFFIKGMA